MAGDLETGDLRAVAAADFWAKLQEAMGKDGLLTYRYLGRKSVDMHGAPYDSMVIRGDMRNAAGGLLAAPLAIATAETGGFTDFNSVPAPVVAGLSLLDDGRDVREIRVRREIIRVGRTMGFSRSIVTDAADPDRVIAVTRAVGVKLADSPAEGGEPFPLDEDIPDSPALPPLHQVFGGYRRSDGVWELPALSAEGRSTSGSLHLGPIHIIFEAAAIDAAAAKVGTGSLQAEDWEVLFVAPGLVGPFAVDGEAAAGGLGRVACQMTLRDRGKDDRVVAVASAVFRVFKPGRGPARTGRS